MEKFSVVAEKGLLVPAQMQLGLRTDGKRLGFRKKSNQGKKGRGGRERTTREKLRLKKTALNMAAHFF